MLISVLGFGSIWTRRAVAADQSRSLDAAYYNTTGVHVGGTLRNRPRVYGLARFNGNSGFRPDRAFEAVGKVFECEAPCIWEGIPKVLFKVRLRRPAKPDAYLVTVAADQSGGIKTDPNTAWLHPDAQLISFSECQDQQEVMVVMPPFAWIRGGLGVFFLEPDARKPWQARLVCPLTRERNALPQGWNRSEVSAGHVHAANDPAGTPHFPRTPLAACAMQDT